MKYLLDASLVTPGYSIQKACVTVDRNMIVDVSPCHQFRRAATQNVLDLDGLFLAPGFLDLQLNGGVGKHFTDDPTAIWEVGRFIPRYGVTSFLACLVSPSPEVLARAQDLVRTGPPQEYRGARLLGLHVEGPFLNPQKRGAHNPASLASPNPKTIEDWSAEAGIRLVTLAPELPGSLNIIGELVARGIVVAAGHSTATYEEALASFDRGIRYGTHLFNAMGSLHHRQPGLAGALLDDKRITVGIVADGIHVHPSLVRLTWSRIGGDRLNLVSDAMGALGMTSGEYRHYGLDIVVREGIAHLKDGTLAGSTLSLDVALRNLIKFTGCDVQEAIKTITTTPVSLLGLADRQGTVAVHKVADLVILNQDFTVSGTIVNGEVAYASPLLKERLVDR